MTGAEREQILVTEIQKVVGGNLSGGILPARLVLVPMLDRFPNVVGAHVASEVPGAVFVGLVLAGCPSCCPRLVVLVPSWVLVF
jgi:hypothetical protein